MANGYVRQSSGLIVTSSVIQASHFNNEYNAIEAFANATTGHNHDGTTGGGAPIPTGAISGLSGSSAGIIAANGAGALAARTLTAPAAGITITNGTGASGNPTLVLANDLAAVEGLSSAGMVARTGTDTWAVRTLTASSNISISDGDGVAANPTIAVTGIGSTIQGYDATLAALAAYNTNGILTQTAADTFAGRTITGTGGTITVTNGSGVSGNPTLTIDAAYVGQTSITTLGTIATGTWSATNIAVNKGGTGLASYTTGDLIQASASTTLASLAAVATGNALISGGIGTVSSWGKIGLTTHVSGILPGANGGTANGFTAFTGPTTALKTFTLPDATSTILTTNAAVTVAQGGTGLQTLTTGNVILGAGTSNVTFVAPGTSGNVLTSNGSTWTSAAATSTGRIIQQVETFSATASTGVTNPPIDNTPPLISEMNAFATTDTVFTPLAATSTLRIELFFYGSANASSDVIAGLYQDATTSPLIVGWNPCRSADTMTSIYVTYTVSAASTSARTYKLYYGCRGGNAYINQLSSTGAVFGGVVKSGIRITEISA